MTVVVIMNKAITKSILCVLCRARESLVFNKNLGNEFNNIFVYLIQQVLSIDLYDKGIKHTLIIFISHFFISIKISLIFVNKIMHDY